MFVLFVCLVSEFVTHSDAGGVSTGRSAGRPLRTPARSADTQPSVPARLVGNRRSAFADRHLRGENTDRVRIRPGHNHPHGVHH